MNWLVEPLQNGPGTIPLGQAVVFDNDLGSPSDNYTDASTTDGYMVEDAFEVTNAAIPEFPVVIAGIVVVGTCFGIYYWMRQRRLAYVKVKA